MSDLPIPKKIFVGAFALCTLLAPIIFGAAAQDDRSFIPLVRTAPAYPSEALAAQREGFVNLGFTIDIVGRTKDIVVVESSSPEFEAPAVAALMSWRYRPVLENDEPVERRGVRTIIRFQLAADVGSQDEAE